MTKERSCVHIKSVDSLCVVPKHRQTLTISTEDSPRYAHEHQLAAIVVTFFGLAILGTMIQANAKYVYPDVILHRRFV
jgi:hypothetical protein